jgi:two-component system OmpR family response regulator
MAEARRTIMVVDDDSVLRRLLTTVLKLRGYDVVPAENGIDAMRLMRAAGGDFDLVLADIIMPKMDGWSLLGHMRSEFPDVPVIMLTVIGDAKPTMERAERMGAKACLFKPVDPASLMSGVDKVLSEATLPPA